MIIDSHQHFWHYNAERDGWITDQMAILKRDFLPEELIKQMRANGIDRCITVQADQSEAETLFLLQLAEKHPEIAGVVGWINLAADNAPGRIEYFSQFEKLFGLRHIIQAEPDDRFMLRQDFQSGIKALARHGLTYDILIYARHLPVAIEFVRRFPNQKVVLDHLAKPSIKSKEIEPWARNIRALAANPNVYCKLSGMVTEADWKHWSEEDLRPYLDVAFEAFGADRLMFGSDWPVCLLAASYGRVKEVVEDYTRSLSENEKEKIFGLNAMRFYGVNTAAWTLN
jgi:L-fuconolactonase